MTERELQADLRALIRRWEADVESLNSSRDRPDEHSKADAVEDCIADLKELLP
jgi:hypothetical protein